MRIRDEMIYIQLLTKWGQSLTKRGIICPKKKYNIQDSFLYIVLISCILRDLLTLYTLYILVYDK